MTAKVLGTSRRPDFVIVGAAKSGTTALYSYLKQHPQIYLPNVKEPHFFGSDLNIWRNVTVEADYLALFHNASPEQRIGEASVWYLYSQNAAQEIKAYCNEAKIIIMLRNPVDMMYSLHNHKLYRGLEDIGDFAKALEAEDERKRGIRIPENSKEYPATLFYRETARFTEQVKRYFEVFGAENVHIILYDDFKANSLLVCQGVHSFLGVDIGFQPVIKPINVNKQAKYQKLQNLLLRRSSTVKKFVTNSFLYSVIQKLRNQIIRWNTKENMSQPMDRQLRNQLLKEFTPEVEALGSLIGRDLSNWIQNESNSSSINLKITDLSSK